MDWEPDTEPAGRRLATLETAVPRPRRNHAPACSGVSGLMQRNSKGLVFSYSAISTFCVYEENGWP